MTRSDGPRRPKSVPVLREDPTEFGGSISTTGVEVFISLVVCWTTGRRLTNQVPKLSLITTLLPWNRGIFRSGPDIQIDVPPARGIYPISRGPQGEYFSESAWGKFKLFLRKKVILLMEGGEIRTRDLKQTCPADDAIYEGVAYWAIGVRDRSITQFRASRITRV